MCKRVRCDCLVVRIVVRERCREGVVGKAGKEWDGITACCDTEEVWKGYGPG